MNTLLFQQVVVEIFCMTHHPVSLVTFYSPNSSHSTLWSYSGNSADFDGQCLNFIKDDTVVDLGLINRLPLINYDCAWDSLSYRTAEKIETDCADLCVVCTCLKAKSVCRCSEPSRLKGGAQRSALSHSLLQTASRCLLDNAPRCRCLLCMSL